MISHNNNRAAVLDQLTKKSVRAFWLDGLWDLVISGMLVIIAVWGMIYLQFVAFPSWTWPILQNAGSSVVWIGLLILVVVLGLYIWIMWKVVTNIKENIISPYTGYARHRFLFPVDPKVYAWYAFLYLGGLGILYGLFTWLTGGTHMMSVPFIISPAAILIGVGYFYRIQRYIWIAAIGFTMAVLLELFAVTQANYLAGPSNFLDILPQWGSPALPCLIWASLFLTSGLFGLIGVWRRASETEPID